LFEEPPVREAKEGAEAAGRGLSREDRETAWRTAIRETVFRFHLVFRTIILAQEALDREALIHAALSAHCALLANDDKLGRSVFPSHAEGLAALRTATLARVAEIHALEEARRRVKARYLDGCVILFPATVQAWAEQRRFSENLAVACVRIAELDGLDEAPTEELDFPEDRVVQFVADHVEHARVTTLDDMDEGRRAVSIAMRWLRPKLSADAGSTP
jgi:hypothetical protein